MGSNNLKRVIESRWFQHLAERRRWKFWEWFLIWRHDFSTKDKMKRVFRRKIDPYQYRTSSYEQDRLKYMESIIAGHRYRSGLEIGCAEGHVVLMLKSFCDHFTAIDLSADALARAKKALNGICVDLVLGNARTWEPNRVFDLIVLADVLYYLGDPIKGPIFERTFDDFLKRINSWLEPGGHILLASGFGTERERNVREDYALRFERLGLKRLRTDIIGVQPHDKGNLKCLLHLLEK